MNIKTDFYIVNMVIAATNCELFSHVFVLFLIVIIYYFVNMQAFHRNILLYFYNAK